LEGVFGNVERRETEEYKVKQEPMSTRAGGFPYGESVGACPFALGIDWSPDLCIVSYKSGFINKVKWKYSIYIARPFKGPRGTFLGV